MREIMMTDDEARIILEIMANADGQCSECAKSLFSEFNEQFPEFQHIRKRSLGEMF
jgi:hypothetical protein